MTGSFLYAPYVPLQQSTIFNFSGEDRTGQLWGDDARELLVTDSRMVHATGSFWSHRTIDLLTDEPYTCSEYKLTTKFKRRA